MDKNFDWQELAARLFCVLVFIAAAMVLPIIAFKLLLPFVLAALVCGFVIPAARKVSRITGVRERACRILLLLIGFLALSSILFVAARRLYAETVELLQKIYNGRIDLALPALADTEILDRVEQFITEAATGFLSSLVNSLGTALKTLAGSVSSIILFLVAFVSSCIYFCLDYEKTAAFVFSILPRSAEKGATRVKVDLVGALGGYLRASVVLFVLVFALAFVGLCALGRKYALTAAFGIALVDMLPVLGTGVVLLPWVLYSVLSGNVGIGVGLAVLWLVITVVRAAVEPRIIGQSIGISPMLSLVATYAGFKLCGVIGMLLAPVVAAVVREIWRSNSKRIDI